MTVGAIFAAVSGETYQLSRPVAYGIAIECTRDSYPIRAFLGDADSDTFDFTVSSNSVNGATIMVSGGWVFYTPAAGFTNADSFTYTIADGRGGRAVATVTVAIAADNAPSQNLVITAPGNNTFRIDGSGIPGRTYRLQFSDLTNPFDWQDIAAGSLTADSFGKFEYTDTTEATMRFYRSVNP